jgi:hypothetical protein
VFDAFLGPEIDPRACGEGLCLPEAKEVDVEAVGRVLDASKRVKTVSQAWGVCVRDPEAIEVEMRAGEGKEIEVEGNNGRMSYLLNKNAFLDC